MIKDLDYYKSLVDFLSIALGENCEIALQDVSKEKFCIVAIANPHISGRKVGSPLTDLALNFLESEIWKEKDYICNYTGRTQDNKLLTSSTYFIKNNNKLLGMLCLNIDNSQYIELSESLLKLRGLKLPLQWQDSGKSEKNIPPSEIETFYENPDDVINVVLEEYLKEKKLPASHLTQNEKMEIINIFEYKGIFRLKGAVTYIAEKLMISEASVYRYRSKLKKSILSGKNEVSDKTFR